MFTFSKSDTVVSISPSIVVFTIAAGLFLYFLYLIQGILAQFFLAFLLMTALRPGVQFLTQRCRVPRFVSIIIMYIVLILVIVVSLGLILPPLVTQLQILFKTLNLPFFTPLQDEIFHLRFDLTQLSSLVNNVGNSLSFAFDLVASAFSSFFVFFTIMIISVYLLIDRPHLYRRIGWITRKQKFHDLTARLIDDIERQLGGWVRGELILMTTVGIATYIGLVCLSVPYALPLAILAGFLEILPNLGPTISAVPALIIAFLMSPFLGLSVLILYILVQQLENNLLVPKIMQSNVDVSPLATIMAILIGLRVAGVVGALLAVPVYIIIRTFVSYWRTYQENGI